MSLSRRKEMTVALRDCRFFARHGLLPHERRAGNEFEITLELTYPVTFNIADNIESTISYADVYELVRSEMEIPSNLLETVVDRIAERILDRWPQTTLLSITLTKLTPPIPSFTGCASITLRCVAD